MKRFNLFALALIVVTFFSCKKILGVPDCEEPLYITNSGIQVAFKDSATNKYLYEQDFPLYNKDSIKIFDPQGDSLLLFKGLSNDVVVPTTGYWAIDFGSLFDYRTDSVSFEREICKQFVVQYSYNERDTITTCFKSKDLKCGSVFSTLKVYHKGNLLASVTNTTYAIITVIKN
jgi:hypothetical protein